MNLNLSDIIIFLNGDTIKNLIFVSHRIADCVHKVPLLPYLNKSLLNQIINDHVGIPRVYMDHNNIIFPNNPINISYRHDIKSPCIAPLMHLRKYITALNIPIHEKYKIDFSTFPFLTKLVVTIYSKPPLIPQLILKSFHVHLKTDSDIYALNYFTSISSPTFVHMRSPKAINIKEIKMILPNASIITPKVHDSSLIPLVKYTTDSFKIDSTNVTTCISIPASLAFLSIDFITSRLIENACVFGSILTIPKNPLCFKKLILFGLSLPKMDSISFSNVHHLSVFHCNNLIELKNIEKCPLLSLTFARNPYLTVIKLPTTLTQLNATYWKPLTLPNLPLLEILELKECPTFRHLVIPPNVKSLTMKQCNKVNKLTNISQIRLKELILDSLPELTRFYFPSTLSFIQIEDVSITSCILTHLTALNSIKLSNCSRLTYVDFPTTILQIEINCCNLLTSITVKHHLCKYITSSCISLKQLILYADFVYLNYLPQLTELCVSDFCSLTTINCSKLPQFKANTYDSIELNNSPIISFLPLSKALSLQKITLQQSLLSELYLNSFLTSLKLERIKNLPHLQLPFSLLSLSLCSVSLSTLQLPPQLTRVWLKEVPLFELTIPTTCSSLKLEKLKQLTSLNYPSSLTFFKYKKMSPQLLSQSLPFIPIELLPLNLLSKQK